MLGFTTCIHPSLVAQWNGPTPGYNYSKTLDKSNRTGKPVPQGTRGICSGVVSFVIENGLLSERGWILQERLLSRKILHWTQYEVSCECNTTIACERMPSGDGNWGNTNPYAWATFRKPVFPDNEAWAQGPEWTRATNKWHSLVGKFSKRRRTVVSDRLSATSNLANLFPAAWVTFRKRLFTGKEARADSPEPATLSASNST
jgi:hypothetical protein